MSKAEAGRVYLDAVCPTNEGARELFEAAQRAGSFYAPDVQPLAADLAESFRAAATTLENPPGAWPEDVQEPILGAVERYLGTYSSLVDLSKATNELQAAEAWNQILQNNDNTAAQLVRLRLDLPAADSADDGC